MGRTLDLSKVPTVQGSDSKLSDYEKNLRYYDRVTFRECFMNPKGLSSFPDDLDMLFYARLNLIFRNCMGKPVIANELTHGLIGETRENQYQKCKNGVYNDATGIYEGALGMDERYYYRTRVLGEKLTYAEIVKSETAKN